MSPLILLPLILSASLVLTMVGLGGGLIFSPMFILLGYPVTQAVSASLFLNGIAAISAAITYFQKKMVDVQIGIPLILSSSVAAPAGAWVAGAVDIRTFTGILAGVIFIAALRMLFSGKPTAAVKPIAAGRRIWGGVIIGLAVGFVAGMLGIGGGVFIVPLLIAILKVPVKTAAATSIFIVVFSSFSGFFAHILLDPPDWRFILPAALFSFAGGRIGSRIMAEKLKGRTVQRIFGIALLLFAIKLGFKILG